MALEADTLEQNRSTEYVTELFFDHNFTAVGTVNTKHTDGKASVSAANAACKLLETLIFSFLLPPWWNCCCKADTGLQQGNQIHNGKPRESWSLITEKGLAAS